MWEENIFYRSCKLFRIRTDFPIPFGRIITGCICSLHRFSACSYTDTINKNSPCAKFSNNPLKPRFIIGFPIGKYDDNLLDLPRKNRLLPLIIPLLRLFLNPLQCIKIIGIPICIIKVGEGTKPFGIGKIASRRGFQVVNSDISREHDRIRVKIHSRPHRVRF